MLNFKSIFDNILFNLTLDISFMTSCWNSSCDKELTTLQGNPF